MNNSVTVRAEPSGADWVCEVEVQQGGQEAEKTTRHTVTVSPDELARWGRASSLPGVQEGVEDLVRRSFEFLLEREPAGSILRRFELSAIERYFPEYDRQFKR